MLQNGKSGICEFINQINGSVDVEQVVVRDFLAMNLVEHGVDITVEITLLVRVLTVAQHLLVIGGLAESGTFLTVKVIEDGRIIV